MAGPVERCMFCADSRGMDIDHSWPIVPYRGMTFRWPNMLWACSDCNRAKSNAFAVDAGGRPLFIDPTVEDPWDSLYYDEVTDNLSPSFDPTTGAPGARGRYAIDRLPLNCEAVSNGRGRTRRNLRRIVAEFLGQVQAGADPEVTGDALASSIHDNDLYGLAHWFFLRVGQETPPFRALRTSQPATWARIQAELRAAP